MGKSTRGSFTMRTSVISFGIILLVPAILADTFTGESVKVGKKTCTCDFTFTVAGNGKAKGIGACDKKCSGAVKEMTLTGAAYEYTFGFSSKKGKVKVGKVTAVAGSTGGTTMPTMPSGSGSGTVTALPTMPGSGSGTGMPGSGTGMPGSGTGMPGSGSGWTGMPTMPPGGSGSGMPGGGYGGDCAPGFLKVCPEMDGTCPYDSMAVCPAPMTMPMGRSLDRMMGQMGSNDGCECVPMVLMQMVMTQQEVMGRSLDRAGGDTFEDESVKVGKKTCTCDFTFTVANNGKAKGTGACDKKCSGAVKEMSLMGDEYEYTFGFSSKKGKVKVGKVSAVGGSTGGTTGMPGGGYGHSGCVCAHMPSDMGTGGSGMPTMPPTGSGSGSGATALPPTGGSGSGATVLPPTGGNGTASSDCTCGIAQRVTKIVGGQETEVNEWPWQVGMVWSGSSSVFCGATVISDEWILTAAHCTDGTAASEIQVLLGEHDYWNDNDGQVRMAISEIVSHPDYDSSNVDNDFALLRMADKINWAATPNIRPACLPEYTAGDYDQWMSTVTGWGTTSSG